MCAKKQEELFCPLEATTSVIGGKWTLEILFHLLEGPKRPSQLRRKVQNLSERMLINRLRQLEDEGIVERIVYEQIPPKVEYKLSEYGLTLKPVLRAMEKWGIGHIQKLSRSTKIGGSNSLGD